MTVRQNEEEKQKTASITTSQSHEPPRKELRNCTSIEIENAKTDWREHVYGQNTNKYAENGEFCIKHHFTYKHSQAFQSGITTHTNNIFLPMSQVNLYFK